MTESDLHRLTQQVAELRKEADQLKHDLADRQAQSERLRDVLHELELQTPVTQAAADTPEKRVCTRHGAGVNCASFVFLASARAGDRSMHQFIGGVLGRARHIEGEQIARTGDRL